MSLFNDFSMTPIFVLGVLVLSGCGDADGPRMANVAGTITFGGEPLAGAEVHFLSGEVEGYGRTNAEGSYTLVRGAPVGECSVYITKAPDDMFAQSIDMTIEGMDAGQIEAMAAGAASRDVTPLLPPEYSDPNQSKLTFDVPDGGVGDADFKL
ncbi:MAG: hypothetical protein ACKVHE_36485 [Planctomycetales bacterium]|jgi:hypothetical protein